ncbi:MAG: Cys-Gln thioester bond-forming surface protein [Clostridiales bacterium]|nr:Cys-Gln thioester bond-forming surface protein [Clostridiales bacterium]
MSMPVIKASNTTRQQSVTDIIASVALEQTALSHILNAEGEKIQKALEPCATFVFSDENHLKAYDFVYQGVIPYYGLVVGEVQTAIIQVTDSISGVNTLTYCFDVQTLIQVGDHYNQTILEGSSDISDVDANRVRSILFNAFPYISVATVAANSSIPNLTQQEAITGAQLAIWKLTNNFTTTITNANVLALYNWYLGLAPTDVIIDPAKINLTAQTIFSNGACGVNFSFDTKGVNADGTLIPLTYTFSKDIIGIYGAVVHESSAGGTTTVQVTNLPQGAAFSINVKGTQLLPDDAYRYSDSQDLTGLFLQTNYMSAECDYLCKGNCNFDVLKVNKSVIDMVKSITLLEMVLQSKLELFGNCLCED